MAATSPFVLDPAVNQILDKVAHANFLSESLSSKEHWHKIIVKNAAKYNKEDVLWSVCNAVLPNGLWPYKFQVEKENVSFLCTQCAPAIKTLCSKGLNVPFLSTEQTLEMLMVVCYEPLEESKTSLVRTLKDLITKRWARSKQELDLSGLHLDPVMEDYYLNLNLYPMSMMLLSCCPAAVSLDLSRNRLSSVKILGLAAARFKKLNLLNLAHNNLEWSGLKGAGMPRVEKLELVGNPLCETSPDLYVKQASAVFQGLQILDGVVLCSLSREGEMLRVRNFLVGRTCAGLVDQLVHHYMRLFESPARLSLVHMYDQRASVSLTTSIIQPSYSVHGLDEFVGLSRNLLKITDYSKVWDKFRGGDDQVRQVLAALPALRIDPASTTIDVPYQEEGKTVLVVVEGVMRDLSQNLFCFDFTFTVRAVAGGAGEWAIHNHMIVVTNVTDRHVNSAFKRGDRQVQDSFETSKEEKLEQFRSLTTMNQAWSTRYLEDSRWDMEQALQSFVDLYKGRQIPQEAFQSPAVF